MLSLSPAFDPNRRAHQEAKIPLKCIGAYGFCERTTGFYLNYSISLSFFKLDEEEQRAICGRKVAVQSIEINHINENKRVNSIAVN